MTIFASSVTRSVSGVGGRLAGDWGQRSHELPAPRSIPRRLDVQRSGDGRQAVQKLLARQARSFVFGRRLRNPRTGAAHRRWAFSEAFRPRAPHYFQIENDNARTIPPSLARAAFMPTEKKGGDNPTENT